MVQLCIISTPRATARGIWLLDGRRYLSIKLEIERRKQDTWELRIGSSLFIEKIFIEQSRE